MIRRRTLLTSALGGASALGLAACGADDPSGGGTSSASSSPSPIDAVEVSGEVGAEPTVTFDAPLTITGPASKIVTAGDGAVIAEGDVLGLRTVYVDAKSGQVLQSAWQGAPANLLAVDAAANGQETADFLTTATVGSRILMLGQVTDQTGRTLSVVQVSDIVATMLPRATGTPQPIPADQPQITLADDGAPQLQDPRITAPPAQTIATVTIQGDGTETADGDTLAMHYTGWKLSDGSQFDSSWDRGEPFSFPLGQGRVIAGWDGPLNGQRVGSQLLLVIPPAEAYGEAGQGTSELAGETLIFVADILGAIPPAGA